MATDRPDQTESALLVPPGLFQLEIGAVHTYDRLSGAPAVRVFDVGGALLRVGVVAPAELRIGFIGWRHERTDGSGTTSGLGDLALGAKVRVVRGGGTARSPDVALIGGVVIPAGDREFRAEGVDPSVRVAVAHDLGAGFGLGYNAGAFWTTVPSDAGGESLETSLLYSVSLGRQLLPTLAAFVEAFGVHGLADGASSWLAVDGGVTVPVMANLQFDLSGGVGLSDAASDWFVSAGLAVRVPR